MTSSLVASLRRSSVARAVLAGPLALRRHLNRQHARVQNVILDRIADNVRGDLILHVAEHDGDFALSPRSDLAKRVLREGLFEPLNAAAFYGHIDPTRDIIDVGANVGFFTVGGAKRLTSGRVLAAEPTAGAFERLSRNVALNGVSDRVILFNGLVSDEPGEFAVNSVAGMEEYSSMATLVHPSVAGADIVSTTATAMTVDQLVEKHGLNPGMIKVDVEGAEHMVFKGAVETIKRHKPFVLSEMAEVLLNTLGGSAPDIVSFFQSQGYRVINPNDPHVKIGTGGYTDMLAIPPGA